MRGLGRRGRPWSPAAPGWPPAPAVPDLTAAVLAALPRELPGVAAAARARLVDTGLRLALLAVGVRAGGSRVAGARVGRGRP